MSNKQKFTKELTQIYKFNDSSYQLDFIINQDKKEIGVLSLFNNAYNHNYKACFNLFEVNKDGCTDDLLNMLNHRNDSYCEQLSNYINSLIEKMDSLNFKNYLKRNESKIEKI